MTFKNSASASQGAMDMLEGGVLRKLLVFAIPLIASGVLQQSFNAVDIAVVGRFASSQALAAVGGNNVVINILVNLFVGVSIGANVVAANYIGRRNEAGVRRTVGSAAALALLSGFLLTILGQLLVHPILVAMSTPGDVLPLASLYLRLFFIGMPFVMVFNFGASLLRSIGDTRRPLYMLIVAGIVNTVLNLLLVVGLDMSVAGVAIATVIAQGLSAAMMVRALLRETSEVKLNLREIRLSRSEVVKMLRIGVPAGLQGMIFSFANIFVQTTINGFGSAAVAGSSASLNFESYSYFVISAFSQAAVSFISQNYGAGRYDRCVEVFRKSMFLALVSSSVLNLSMAFFREPLASLFSSDPEVLSYA
ncbi:MAG: MATE family efflux transporter, partial [Paramuribaculum sp.]|nr:MATE family efflux transporter [Paramuribaculum sp.]